MEHRISFPVLVDWERDLPCMQVRKDSSDSIHQITHIRRQMFIRVHSGGFHTWHRSLPLIFLHEDRTWVVDLAYWDIENLMSFSPGFLVPIRLAFFWVSNYSADIVSAFLATGILRMRGIGGKAGWRYLFLIEGFLTLVVGSISFFMMPPGPTQTKAWYRPKGWFNERYSVSSLSSRRRDHSHKFSGKKS